MTDCDDDEFLKNGLMVARAILTQHNKIVPMRILNLTRSQILLKLDILVAKVVGNNKYLIIRKHKRNGLNHQNFPRQSNPKEIVIERLELSKADISEEPRGKICELKFSLETVPLHDSLELSDCVVLY